MNRLVEGTDALVRKRLLPLLRRVSWAPWRLFHLPLLAHVTAAVSMGLLSYLVWSALRESADERDAPDLADGDGHVPPSP